MILSEKISPVCAKEQLASFNQNKPSTMGELLVFTGTEGLDVYNTSIPFELEGKLIIAGRVESRSNEVSQTKFFEKAGDKWQLIPDAPVLDLQDPFITFIQGELWLGGVYVVWDGDRLVKYSTYFYRGTSLATLTFAFEGPLFMKDIRLLEMNNGKIAVFSRPQGEKMIKSHGCIAKIGFAIANKAEEINAEFIENAPLLEGQFTNEEWGGANQIYSLSNGLIGIIGHKSWGEDINDVHIIHYYSMAFALDPETCAVTQTKIIAARDCFPAGPQKDKRSADVVFTSGIIRGGNGSAELYAGLSDCQAGRITIPDPFDEYEKLGQNS